MNNLLLKWYVSRRTEQMISKTPHYCSDCKKTDITVRRMSVLYLLGYILIGVVVGYFFNWWLGFVATFACLFINAKVAKRQCKHCLSTHVHIPNGEVEHDEVSNEHTPS
ncbi:hypothetical protein ACFVS2_21550 [Brevibacillus sp. NPDC058079]|uniref:hypothetical protein n=1 Tax=Brevibacillus sp. NPDC058079 TaxID=3346330 RepID=UPI0036E4F73B